MPTADQTNPTAEPAVTGTVYALIPVFNRWKYTRACLTALAASRLPEGMRLTPVVIDDGSSDETPRALPAEFPEARVITGDGNLWWTGAMALAVDTLSPGFAAGDYVLLLNNDSLTAPDTVARLIEVSRRRGGAMVAAMAREADRHLHVGGRFVWRGMSPGRVLWQTEEDIAGLPPEMEAHFLFGHATIMPAGALGLAGNFNPRGYPQYYGDTEFSYRAHKAGVPLVVATGIVVDCYEDQESTGLHFGHAAEPSLAGLRDFLFSVKSAFNLPGTWRFASEHAPGPFPRFWALKICAHNTMLGLAPFFNKYNALRPLKAAFVHCANLSSRPTPVSGRELAKAGFTAEELLAAGVLIPSTRWRGHYSLLDDGRPWPEGLRGRLEPLLRKTYRLGRRLAWPLIYAFRRLPRSGVKP